MVPKNTIPAKMMAISSTIRFPHAIASAIIPEHAIEIATFTATRRSSCDGPGSMRRNAQNARKKRQIAAKSHVSMINIVITPYFFSCAINETTPRQSDFVDLYP
jgi:hypothetical protein